MGCAIYGVEMVSKNRLPTTRFGVESLVEGNHIVHGQTARSTRSTSSRIRPNNIKRHILQSPRKDQSGYWNVAGLLCSMKKWPIHAKPYPSKNPSGISHKLPVMNVEARQIRPSPLPMKCRNRQPAALCSRT